jgi:hypothetical protein
VDGTPYMPGLASGVDCIGICWVGASTAGAGSAGGGLTGGNAPPTWSGLEEYSSDTAPLWGCCANSFNPVTHLCRGSSSQKPHASVNHEDSSWVWDWSLAHEHWILLGSTSPLYLLVLILMVRWRI